MTTSGTSAFTATRNQIISGALRKIVAIGSGLPIQGEMLSDASFALNGMVKHWEGQGIHVWTNSTARLFIQPGQRQYALGGTSTDHCATTFVSVLTTASAAAAAASIVVESITGIAASDHIGITLDDGTIQWTTVNGAPAGSTVSLSAALTDSVALGNQVWTYTSDIVQPLKIVQAQRFNADAETDTPMMMLGRTDYFDLPNKDQLGTITNFYYDRQLTTGQLYLWSAPQDVVDGHVNFQWHRPIMDFNTAADTSDLPQEWIQTLQFNLAVIMAPEFDVPDGKFRQIKSLADQYLSDMIGFDREEGSIFVQPDYSGRR